MTEIVFAKPGKQTPGFLRRLHNRITFEEKQKNAQSDLERFENMVTFLLDFVTSPADRNEAKEALMDASQEQIDGLYEVLGEKTETVPPVKGES